MLEYSVSIRYAWESERNGRRPPNSSAPVEQRHHPSILIIKGQQCQEGRFQPRALQSEGKVTPIDHSNHRTQLHRLSPLTVGPNTEDTNMDFYWPRVQEGAGPKPWVEMEPPEHCSLRHQCWVWLPETSLAPSLMQRMSPSNGYPHPAPTSPLLWAALDSGSFSIPTVNHQLRGHKLCCAFSELLFSWFAQERVTCWSLSHQWTAGPIGCVLWCDRVSGTPGLKYTL